MVREWCVLYILTWKCASRHNGVQLFISHLASWLRTRRFSEPAFRPSWATNHWKNTVNCDFPTPSRICIFFLLTLSLLIFSLLIFLFSLPLPCSAFHLSILSEVWLLNFLRRWQRPWCPVKVFPRTNPLNHLFGWFQSPFFPPFLIVKSCQTHRFSTFFGGESLPATPQKRPFWTEAATTLRPPGRVGASRYGQQQRGCVRALSVDACGGYATSLYSD